MTFRSGVSKFQTASEQLDPRVPTEPGQRSTRAQGTLGVITLRATDT